MHLPTSQTPSYGAGQLAARLVLTLVGLLGASLLLSHLFKRELEDVARLFYDKFGSVGALAGTWLADGFSFPVPPQAYMLLAEANGVALEVLPAILVGSIAGGVTGYLVAPALMRFAWVRAWIERTESKVTSLCDERWISTSLFLSASPLAFSWLCYSAALYRVPKRTLALLCVLRIPKLVLYQQLISWGWS